MIMSKAKTVEERHFYITLCIKESYSSRELERQIENYKTDIYNLKKKHTQDLNSILNIFNDTDKNNLDISKLVDLLIKNENIF